MTDTRAQLLRLLREKAYREGTFTLASGRTSDFYVDSKLVTLDPEGINLVGQTLFEIVSRYDVQAVGGLTMGADPIVTAVAGHSWRAGRPIPAFIVRKEPKGHGTQKWIEGPEPAAGSRVAIVDDVITSGGSSIKAVEAARRVGCEVAIVASLLDREEGGRANLEKLGCTFESVFTLTELRARR